MKLDEILKSLLMVFFHCIPLQTSTSFVYVVEASQDYHKADDYLSCSSRWIRDAVKHNVVELDLDLFLYDNDNYHGRSRRLGDLKLPIRLFTCKTLVALKVNSNCMNLAPPPSASACFPSLKSLDFKLRRPRGSASMLEKLVSKCPVLEDLTIDADALFGKDVYALNIHGAALKRYKIVGNYLTDKYSFSINAPKLEKFVVSGEAGLSNCNFSNNAKAMVKAVIHLTHPAGREEEYCIIKQVDAPRLLERVSGVEYLCLSAPSYSATSLPWFYNLKHLKLRLFLCSYWEYVMELLKRSPNLEDIVLDICPWTWMNDWYNFCEEFRPFHPPEVVPTCVSSHLKTISIINFFGFEDEFDVVKYLLKHSEVLRRLTISTCENYLINSRRMVPEKLHKKALKLQKYSKTCEIEVMIRSNSSKIQNKECSCKDDISHV